MKKVFLLANVLVALVLCIIITRSALVDRAQVIEAAYNELENVTAALAEHTQQTLMALDLGLVAVALVGQDSLNDPDALNRVVSNRQAASVNTYAFYVLDRNGRSLSTSRTTDPEPFDLSRYREFTVHQENAHDGMYIAVPRLGVVGLAEGQWVINVSRRIPAADGSFAGVAAASMSMDYLSDFYDALRAGDQSALGLLSAEGAVIARSPFDPALVGVDFSQTSLFRQVLGSGTEGRVTDIALQGEVPRLSAYRYTWDNQLIAYANITEAEVLAEWRGRLLSKMSIGLLMMLTFAGSSVATIVLAQRQQQFAEQTLRTKQQAQADVNAAKAEIETIFNAISDAVFSLDSEWQFDFLNAEAERVLERPAGELLGKRIWEEFPELEETGFARLYKEARTTGGSVAMEQYYRPLNKWFVIKAYPHDKGMTVYLQDFTRQKEMEERLRQAQKMDALGQLTGGIAHDFNNLLTVILGNIDMLAEHLQKAPEGIRGQADVIRIAGERAAELTHRLLAFARRQPLNPQQTDINALVLEAKQLLERTVGADINIELVCGQDLWPAIVDPHELQNAILNLALNARDAMPYGGKLTIETGNSSIAPEYADLHGMSAGNFVMIAVSDSGCGMPPDIVAQAFDPFFTTKEEGKGSGLGLAMVYGFARQSGGQVKIYSESGQGTTVRLYLPRVSGNAEPEYRATAKTPDMTGGDEHILLVEDDELVRRYAVTSLRQLGYQVSDFGDGAQALDALREAANTGAGFALLLTDVVLAGGISGKEVATEAARIDPGMKILYMSGYAENAIVHHGRLDPGVNLLSKPFRTSDLARKVREMLDS
ncbi:MAG: ATP-binding protein [Pseudohongiella sp.]|uniref:ATP-binding protein n=1 Tax=Pseudohongiella sp. TaxID=1979412 RepID=UPI00349FE2B1